MLTVREIKSILRQEHISISKHRGQNFLIDAYLEKKIIVAINIKPGDEILEIGPGLGALTEDLARQARYVIAVEKDKALARILQDRLSDYRNLCIVCKDILHFTFPSKKKLKVVGNLPFYITTPIIVYLLEQGYLHLSDIFITVQEEVGKRLVARAGSKDYSALTLFVQYFARPRILFSIPKRAFYPQPRVDSVFVHLHTLPRPPAKVDSQERFFKIVRAGFSQRRKTLLNSLSHRRGKDAKGEIAQALKEAGVDFRARAERLSFAEFARIANIFYKRRLNFA